MTGSAKRIDKVQRKADIFRMVLEGATLAATGRQFGVSGPAVRQLIGRIVSDIRGDLEEREQPAPISRGVRELRENKDQWGVLVEEWQRREIEDPGRHRRRPKQGGRR